MLIHHSGIRINNIFHLKTKEMKKDSDFVDTTDYNEVHYWAKKFNITRGDLLKVIEKIGNKTSELKIYFKHQAKSEEE